MEKKLDSDKKVEKKVELTNSDKIWQEVKDLKIDMFALPHQQVSQYCKKVEVEPSKCYVLISVSAALPALEASIPMVPVPGNNPKFPDMKPKFVVERVDKYVTIAYAPYVTQ